MGAQLVGQAFAVIATRSVKLKPNEALLLVYMALTALDSDIPPRYFAAPAASAIALGRMLPEDDPGERHSILESVRRAQQGLVSAGLIRRVKKGARGTRSEYELVLHNGVISAGATQRNVASSTQRIVANNATNRSDEPNESLPLRNTGTTGTTEEEKSRPGRAPHFPPVDKSKSKGEAA